MYRIPACRYKVCRSIPAFASKSQGLYLPCTYRRQTHHLEASQPRCLCMPAICWDKSNSLVRPDFRCRLCSNRRHLGRLYSIHLFSPEDSLQRDIRHTCNRRLDHCPTLSRSTLQATTTIRCQTPCLQAASIRTHRSESSSCTA